jgi:hypothetical protein
MFLKQLFLFVFYTPLLLIYVYLNISHSYITKVQLSLLKNPKFTEKFIAINIMIHQAFCTYQCITLRSQLGLTKHVNFKFQ